MTLLQQIQTNFKNREITDIVKALGYKSSKNAKVTQALTELLSITDIADYLDKSYYDFKYNSRTLLKAICRVAGVSKIDYAVTIDAYEDRKRRLEALQNPYIFVDTNFKRRGEPIFALAMLESKRRINLDKEMYLERSEEEINAYISNAVKLHYKWRKGTLPVWGEIRAYLYYDTEGKRTVYSVLGDVIEDDTVQESRASVSLKTKHLVDVRKEEKQ